MSQIKLFAVSLLLVALLVSSIASVPIDNFEESVGYASEPRGASYSNAEVNVIQHLASLLNETPEQLLKDLAILKLAKQLHAKSADMQASKRGHIWKRAASS